MAFQDFSRLRMQNMFGPQSGPTSIGNPIFDTFLKNIFPIIQQGQRQKQLESRKLLEGERNYLSREKELDRDFQWDLANLRERPAINPAVLPQPERPMNTVYDPGISPYQQAQLALRARQLESGEETAESRLALETRKLEEATRKNTATQELATRKVVETERANKERADIARKRASIAEIKVNKEMSEEEKINLQSRLQKELQELRGNDTLEAINLRGEIQEKLLEIRGKQRIGEIVTQGVVNQQRDIGRIIAAKDAPAATKQRILNNYQAMIVEKPQYGELIDYEDGIVKINDNATPEQAEEIRKYLLGSAKTSVKNDTETKTEDKPPAGAKPGGTWRTLSSGRRVYVPPS